jgi:hypothetical protein
MDVGICEDIDPHLPGARSVSRSDIACIMLADLSRPGGRRANPPGRVIDHLLPRRWSPEELENAVEAATNDE